MRPSSMQTFEVRWGPAQSLGSGDLLQMVVRFTPSTSVIWAATKTPLIAYCETVTPAAGLQGSAVLPSPDQVGFVDSAGHTVRGFTYQADITYQLGAKIVGRARKTFTFTSAMTSPLDLEAAVPMQGTSGETLAVPMVAAAALVGDDLVLTDLFGDELFRGKVRGKDGVNSYDGGTEY